MKLAFDRLLRRKATLECGSEFPLPKSSSSRRTPYRLSTDGFIWSAGASSRFQSGGKPPHSIWTSDFTTVAPEIATAAA